MLTLQSQKKIDIVIISKPKLHDNFPTGHFLINSFKTTFRVNRNGHGSDIRLYIRKDVPVKVLSVEIENQIEGFFVKINLKNKKRWLINCSYNRYRDNIANYISTISKSTDIYTSKYDNLFLGDFNVGIEDFHLKNFKYI